MEIGLKTVTNKNKNSRCCELKKKSRISEKSERFRIIRSMEHVTLLRSTGSIDRKLNDTDETQRTTYKKKQRCNDGDSWMLHTGCSDYEWTICRVLYSPFNNIARPSFITVYKLAGLSSATCSNAFESSQFFVDSFVASRERAYLNSFVRYRSIQHD